MRAEECDAYGNPEQVSKVFAQLAHLEVASPGPRRLEMLRQFVGELMELRTCRHCWEQIEKRLDAVLRIPEALQ